MAEGGRAGLRGQRAEQSEARVWSEVAAEGGALGCGQSREAQGRSQMAAGG